MSLRKGYLLSVLTVILAFNYVDRFALGVVLQDIKTDLNVTDTQLGLLTGIAFAIFYSTMGIPIARWADRGNRVTIISLTAMLWSVAVALCGMAANFTQLLFARMGVAIGEAGCYPPGLSLISDYFSRGERPRAVARYLLGIPLAVVIGNFAAGWLNEFYGWRTTFIILGLPGLGLAALAKLTLRETRPVGSVSGKLPFHQASSAPELTVKEVLATLWSNTAYRHLLLCFSVWGFFGYGIMQWQPAFFVRSHGLHSGELGTWFSVIYGVGGLLGAYLGGELASRYATNNERLQLLAVAIVYAISAALNGAAYLVPNHHVAFAILGISNFGASAGNGPLFSATQTLVPPRMRAMSIALMYFFCNLIGLGLGPLAVGVISDTLQPWLGQESLRYALLVFCPGFLWCAWHLWKASRTVARDVAAVQADEESLGWASNNTALAE